MSGLKFYNGSSWQSVAPAPQAAMVGFTSSTTYVVPNDCTMMNVVVVGGGRSGVTYTDVGYDGYFCYGGWGGQVVQQNNISVVSGETLTVVVGGSNQSSSISGSFGTITATTGPASVSGGNTKPAGNPDGENGTYVSGWGWFGGAGGAWRRVAGNGYAYRPGGYGGGGSSQGSNTPYKAPAPNSGGGAGTNTSSSPQPGATGFVGIFIR